MENRPTSSGRYMPSSGGPSQDVPFCSESMPSTNGNADSNRSEDKLSSYCASGLKNSLHGTIYQLQLLMLFAFRGVEKYYDFKLATEMDKAEKFDDVVFGYKKTKGGNFTWRFLQAKHKQDPVGKKITVNNLIKEKDGDFSLLKYFISFCNINVKKEDFEEQDDFTICTNTDFDFKTTKDKQLVKKWKNLITDPQEFKDDILCFEDTEAKELRFKRDKNSLDAITKELELELFKTALSKEKIFKGKWELSLKALEKITCEKELEKYKEEVLPACTNLQEKKTKTDVEQGYKRLISLAKEFDKENILTQYEFKNLKGTEKDRDKLKEKAKEFKENILTKLKSKLNVLQSEDLNDEQNLQNELVQIKKNVNDLKKIKAEIIADNKGAVFEDIVEKKANSFGISKTTLQEIKKYTENNQLGLAKDALCKNLDALICDLQIIQIALKEDTVKEIIKNFILKFRFIVKYPDVDTLNDRINGEFKNCFKYLEANLMTNTFEKNMLDWFKEKGGTYLNKAKIKDFRKLISDKLKTLIVVGMNKVHRNKLESYGIQFQESINEVETFLTSKNKQILSIISPSTRLSAIRVNQTLENLGYYTHHGKVIFMKLGTLMHEKTKKIVLDTFGNKVAELLVIECKNSKPNQKNEKDLSDDLLKKLEDKTKKIIIIVASNGKTQKKGRGKGKGKPKGKDFATDFIKKSKKEIIKATIENKFKHLNKDSKNLICDKEVNFQDKNITLKDILKEEAADEIIDESILAYIIEENEIKIGHTEAFRSLNYYPDYYTTRTLYSFEDKKELLKEKKLFFVTGIEKGKLIELLGNEFEEEVCTWEEESKKRIFYSPPIKTDEDNKKKFKEFDDDRIWLELRNDRLNVKKEETSEKWNLDEKIITIVDIPGMGKSTFLTSFATRMKDKFPKVWFVRINLNDFAGVRKRLNLKKQKTKKQIISFISLIAVPGLKNVSNEFQRYIFKLGLEKKDNVEIVVIFDGLDEIGPRFNNHTLKIIDTLKDDSSVKQLWITTRNPPKINSGFDSYILKPFNFEEAKQFLDKFWKWSLKYMKETNRNDYEVFETCKKIKESLEKVSKNEPRFNDSIKNILESRSFEIENLRNKIDELNFENYAEEVLEQWKKSIDEFTTEFIGVPLHLEMLGTVIFEKKFQPLTEFGLVILYHEFIKHKFEIYYQEKAKVVRGNQAADALRAITMGTLSRIHQEEALKTFFEEEELLPLGLNEMEKFRSDLDLENIKSEKSQSESEKEERKLDYKKELSRVGVLVENNGLQFIHRSYAEYFISEYLITNWKKKHVSKFYNETISIKEDYAHIKSFFFEQLKIQKGSEKFLATIKKEINKEDRGSLNRKYLRTLSLS